MGERRKRCWVKWNALSAHAKQDFKAMADAVTDLVKSFEHLDFAALQASAAKELLSAQQFRALSEASIARTLDAMAADPILTGGLGLGSVESGLRVEFVSNASDDAIKQRSSAYFGYCDRVRENPKGPMALPLVCSMRYGGLCPKTDESAEASVVASKNVHH